jgi:hypothetical protein
VSITEYERHQVFQWCEQAMGPERAAIMMRLLPPVGWHDIATRTDLHALESGLRGEMHVLGSDLRAELRALNSETLRTMVVAMVASNATLVGLVLAATRLG